MKLLITLLVVILTACANPNLEQTMVVVDENEGPESVLSGVVETDLIRARINTHVRNRQEEAQQGIKDKVSIDG